MTLLLPGRSLRCPRCLLGGVLVREAEWRDGAFWRRSVWVDEPLRCTERCTLTGDAVIRLLLVVDAQPAYQLPLLPDEPPAEADRVTAAAPAERATWLLAQVTEAELQAFVVRTARLLGYRVFHPRFSVGSDTGWPDLAMASPEQQRMVFAELKREGRKPTRTRYVNGRLRQGQDSWLLTLAEAGQEVYWWMPSDRADLTEILQHGPRPDMPCLARLRDFLREDAAIPGGGGG